MKENVVLWLSDLGHPEDGQHANGWERRPESRGLKSTEGERRADVEGIEAVRQENPDESMKSHLLHGRDWWREWRLKMSRFYNEETGQWTSSHCWNRSN